MKDNINVCFFAHAANLTGASQSLVDLINELKKRKINPIVILPKSGELESLLKDNGILYEIVRNYSWIKKIDERKKIKVFIGLLINKIKLLKISYLLKRKNIKIIHINSLLNYIGMDVAQKLDIPVVWHIREFMQEDHHVHFIDPKNAIKKINQSESIICISDPIYEKFRKKLSVQDMKIIYNGVKINKYSLQEKKIFLGDEINVMIFGRICEGKGQLDSVKSLNHLINYYNVKNVRLHIVGNGIDNYENIEHEYVKNNSLNNYVTFVPFTKDLTDLRKKCDIQLVCSQNEAFGRVTIEGMLSKCLVIGSNSGFTPLLIKDNETGLLYESGNSIDLAEKLYSAIRNKNQMQVITEQGFDYVVKNYSIKNTAEKVLDVYRKLISNEN